MARVSVEEICKHAKITCDPGYYSGRGATTSDLNDGILQRAHDFIKHHIGDDAAKAHVEMVAALPTASATGYLRSLYDLESNDWTWTKGKEGANDIYPTNEGSAFGTMMSVLGRMHDDPHDQTYKSESVRGDYLRRHRHKEARDPHDVFRRYGR